MEETALPLHPDQADKESFPLLLTAGPLHMLYEPASGFLRRISLGRREVWRGLYVAVRDENWRTIPPQITELQREAAKDHFQIQFECAHQEGPIEFKWRGFILGEANGRITYEMDGVACRTFRRNRIGFCLLHPIRECAGARVRQRRSGGEVVEGHFPRLIEPQVFGASPLRDLRALAHEIRTGLWAEAVFEGDIFEMEDQRNWTDASFKTYCTPLALPFPVEIKAGTRIRQKVSLFLRGNPPGRRARASYPPRTVVQVVIPEAGDAWRPMPAVGTIAPTTLDTLSRQAIHGLKALHLAHLRVDLTLEETDFKSKDLQAVELAERLGVPVELALHWGRNLSREVACGIDARRFNSRLIRVLALQRGEAATSPATLHRVRQWLADRGIQAKVGVGTDAHFCELNRGQFLGQVPVAQGDFLFWPITPQVHAFDRLSVVETLEAQGDTLRTAQVFAPQMPLVITPITLRPRFNAVATTNIVTAQADGLADHVDVRQSELWVASWTVGTLAALASAGAASITMYEAAGCRGLMFGNDGICGGPQFPADPGTVFPVYFVLAALVGFPLAAAPKLASEGRLTALVLRNRRKLRVLLGNVLAAEQSFRLVCPGRVIRWRLLDHKAWQNYRQQPAAFFIQSDAVAGRHKGLLEEKLPAGALAFVELDA